MIAFAIPGFGDLRLEHLVLDFNGTLAEDGVLLSGVQPRLAMLSEIVMVHAVTADTFGCAADQLAGLPLRLTILQGGGQAEAKVRYVHQLGADRVVAIGNGRNDSNMLQAAALGIAVIQREGSAFATLAAANVVVASVIDALELLLHRDRLVATLRS